MKTKYTQKQIDDWKAFEKVRASGRFNMFDPRAGRAAKLTGPEYGFVMDNYSEIKAQINEL